MFARQLKVVSARYTGPGTTPLFPTKTLSVVVTAKADDLHDTLLIYATDRACATHYESAIAQTMTIEQTTGGVSELTDVDLGSTPGAGVSVRRTGRYAYRYTVTNPQVAPALRTVCAMLYDSPGDPRYPGNPHNIPARHVWQTARGPIRVSAGAASVNKHTIHRSLQIVSAVLSPQSSGGPGSGKIVISSTDPTHNHDRLFVYLRRGSCYRTYKAASRYVSRGGYAAQITDGPAVPAHGSLSYPFSGAVGAYSKVCAMLYRDDTPNNASGAPEINLRSRYQVFRTVSARLRTGATIPTPCPGLYC